MVQAQTRQRRPFALSARAPSPLDSPTCTVRFIPLNTRPRRRLEPSRGVADCVGVDMTQTIAACARPTKKYPEGRTGTSAGYSAHRAQGEPACDPCRLANNSTTKIRAAARVEAQRRHYRANRGMYAYRAIRLKYNLSEAQYKALLQAQGERCAICGTEVAGNRGRLLNVDHDHACCPGHKSCGKCVRGLLCARCNVGLGSFRDDPDRLLSAATYLATKRMEAADA